MTVRPQYSGEVELTPDVTFTCTAGTDAACHRFPLCDCESWTDDEIARGFDDAGHEVVSHARCWISDWFENGGHHYTGAEFDDTGDYNLPPGFDRSGPVAIDFGGDYIEWTFA